MAKSDSSKSDAKTERSGSKFRPVGPRRDSKKGAATVVEPKSVDAPPPERWYGYGFSTIIAAGGEVVASAKSLYGEEIVITELPM